eukprot:gene3772-3819_t
MKKIFIALASFAILAAGCGQNPPQQNNVTIESNNAPAGFDVNKLAQLVKTSTDPQTLEKAINDPNNKVNNLDLDKDGNIDYLKVEEPNKNQLNVVDDVSSSDSVTVARIKVSPNADNTTADLNFLLLSYLMRPHSYYMPMYHYGYYPSYYSRTRTYTTFRPTTSSAMSTRSSRSSLIRKLCVAVVLAEAPEVRVGQVLDEAAAVSGAGMSIFDRLFRIGKAEANAAVDKLEDPAKMADQILRELRSNYQQAIQGEAEIKALALQHRASELQYRNSADDWEKKTNELLDRIETKQLDEAKGNELATKAAEAHQTALNQADQYAKMAEKEESAVAVMDLKIKQIKDQIADTESRAQLISSRAKTAEVSEKISKTLSSVDTDGLMATLNRMDQKASAQEFRAAAYAQIDDSTLSTEQEINKALSSGSTSSALEAIKAKRTKLLN